MKTKLLVNNIAVKNSNVQGYGVFAEADIQKDEVIEECYMLISNTKPVNELNDYFFEAGEKFAFPLGFGSIYNHSDTPNASYSIDALRQLLIFKSNRFIRKGEEIFISYGENWFASRKLPKREISKLNFINMWRFFLGIPLRALSIIAMVYFFTYLIAKIS